MYAYYSIIVIFVLGGKSHDAIEALGAVLTVYTLASCRRLKAWSTGLAMQALDFALPCNGLHTSFSDVRTVHCENGTDG